MDERDPLPIDTSPERLGLLGFRPDDAADARAAADRVAADPAAARRVAELADRLRAVVGVVAAPVGGAPDVFAPGDDEHAAGRGVLPLLAFLATVDDVRAFHRSRGIDEATSWASLADLGQQVWVNRLTYGAFGLHTHRWLVTAWSGALYALGRLQANLDRLAEGAHRGELVLSVHIPQTGPLDPAAVDASLARAEEFFAAHFPELHPAWFHCESWLLDPRLAAGLPGSNIAAFQARWELFDAPLPGTADAVFFTFRRRGPVAADDLPTRSRLEALVADHVRTGEPLHVRHGRIRFSRALAGAASR